MPATRCLLFLFLLVAPSLPAFAQQQRDYDAERRYLESLRRDIDAAKRDAKNLENAIESRRKQLADAPKTIKPAEQAVTENTKRWEEAKAGLPEAKKRLDTANDKLKNVLTELKTKDESAAQLDAAENKVEGIEFRISSMRQPAIDKLRARDDYRKLAERRDDIQKRIKTLKDEAATTAEMVDASNQLLAVQSDLHDLEDAELEKTPEFAAAQKELQAAQANLRAVRITTAERLKNNPQFVAADKDTTAARMAFADANKELNESSRARFDAISKVASLKSQARSFEAETNSLAARKVQVENRVRTLERRYDDYRRNLK